MSRGETGVARRWCGGSAGDGKSAETEVHGVFLEILEVGVLIIGKSGAGKSELGLALVRQGHRLVADDALRLVRTAANEIQGYCPDVGPGFIEVRGLGVLNVQALFGPAAVCSESRLELVVALETGPDRRLRPESRLEPARSHHRLLGIDIPKVTLAFRPERDRATLVECIVRDHLARRDGYDARADLESRLARTRRESA